jgi:hypothetical protein
MLTVKNNTYLSSTVTHVEKYLAKQVAKAAKAADGSAGVDDEVVNQ